MRVYTLNFENINIAAVQDIFGLYTGASIAVRIHEIALGQITGTTNQNLRLRINRLTGTITNGSGGTTVTPRPMQVNDAASIISAAHVNDTTQASGTTSVTVRADVWNTINGYLYLPAPEDRIVVAPSEALILSLMAAPASGLFSSGTLTFEELF